MQFQQNRKRHVARTLISSLIGCTQWMNVQVLEKRLAKKGAIDLELDASRIDKAEKAVAQGKAIPKTHSIASNK